MTGSNASIARTFTLTLPSLCIAVASVAAQDADRVRLTSGSSERGRIEQMTDTKVTLNKGGQRTKEIPVNEIASIFFGGEPSDLAQARVLIRNGAYKNALTVLEKIDRSDLDRVEMRQDVAFYEAFATAKLALLGDGDLNDAGGKMYQFVSGNRRNYHYYAAQEAMGDLLAAVGKYPEAEASYARLAESPWPDYQVRAAVLQGRMLAAQGKHEQALAQFDNALSIEADPDVVKEQMLAARLGKARSQAETGDVNAAIGVVEQVISEAAPETLDLQARAHNALGYCHVKANNPRDALYAFLYTDVMCEAIADAHAEALYNLVPLYRAVGREEDARKTRLRLLERYPNTSWAKQV